MECLSTRYQILVESNALIVIREGHTTWYASILAEHIQQIINGKLNGNLPKERKHGEDLKETPTGIHRQRSVTNPGTRV